MQHGGRSLQESAVRKDPDSSFESIHCRVEGRKIRQLENCIAEFHAPKPMLMADFILSAGTVARRWARLTPRCPDLKSCQHTEAQPAGFVAFSRPAASGALQFYAGLCV